MARTKVTRYSLAWDHQQKLGSVSLWMETESRFPVLLTKIDAKEFAAISMILRADPAHDVYYEPSSNTLLSGLDTP